MASGDILPRFYTVFLSNISSNSLLIPRVYYEHLPRRLPKTAILTGTGGRFWKVAMMSKREQVYFERGWGNFVADNDLKDGEFLTFVFDGHKSYEVSIYGRGECKETRAVIQVEEISDETESDNDSLGSLVDVTPMPVEENSDDDTEGDDDSGDSVVDVTPMPVEEISDASENDSS
ncbi:B3 DNA binding domain [Arabidopsis suecica]|uniref:B3 DNA binding domain n=1 Tax=Arabidopsis suecica TaxID=45249 RepID=A0A8T2B8M6_ARASU|nr:B3 DNA binding domain [Arabidopsis suecica]